MVQKQLLKNGDFAEISIGRIGTLPINFERSMINNWIGNAFVYWKMRSDKFSGPTANS